MNKIKIVVAGWRTCSFFQKTANAVSALNHLYPNRVEAVVQEHDSRDAYKQWLSQSIPHFTEMFGSDSKSLRHTSSPFVYEQSADGTSKFIGGCDDTFAYLRDGFFNPKETNTQPIASDLHSNDLINDEQTYDYDLIVIGGGSGGLACSKAAAAYGQKVCVLDYVKPSPLGTSWGLGGTCVNVGCIPKKLMHQSSLIGELMHKDSSAFGWSSSDKEGDEDKPKFQWATLVESVQDYIRGLNFKYRVDLRDKKVKYENFLGEFVDAHTVRLTNEAKKKAPKTLTARRFVVAVGGRPSPLSIPGGEHAISSDDIFQLDRAPGKTLVIGASYVALECAGFLKGMGYDVTIMVRSILLRGFDQDMANRIGDFMETESEISFVRQCVPTKIEKLENGQLKVQWTGSSSHDDPTSVQGEGIYDTVLSATGRYPDVSKLGLDKVGVELNKKSGRILVKNEQTNVPHIYAIGDVIDAPELTPVAIQAGRLLSSRLYNNSKTTMDYNKICTAVFTPIEYGCCGYSEEDSLKVYGGEENISVYHQSFTPLEWSLSHSRKAADACYVKVICLPKQNMEVVGFHYLGPNAGEVTQAVGVAMKMRATFDDFKNTVGIHPTTAEIFTTLEITKESGEDAAAGGC